MEAAPGAGRGNPAVDRQSEIVCRCHACHARAVREPHVGLRGGKFGCGFAALCLMYVLAAIAILQGMLTLLDGLRAARHMRTFRPRRFSRERVAVFCPCKGADSEFV